jgi:hypothetical protein
MRLSKPAHWYAAMALVVACGFVLRWANAQTAYVHDDEQHYVGDALWSRAPLGGTALVRFLYEHPHEHPRLDPTTGSLARWGAAGEVARLGHPTLFAAVTGVVLAATRPSGLPEAIVHARVVNALADTVAIVLVAVLAARLGYGDAAGLLAAGLYALFPPAATYGSLAYLDAFLAPLFLLVLVCLVDRRWLAAGVASGLLLATKQSGIVALAFVPLVWALRPPRRPAALVRWGLATVVVTSLLVSPAAYVDSIRNPTRPVGVVQTAPLATLAGNLAAVARPSAYYWLSFSQHGQPLAPFLARAHGAVTPVYLTLAAAAFATAWLRRRRDEALLLQLPVALTLAFVQPSNGMWRLHLLFPLACAAVACAIVAWPRPVRLAALVVALGVGVSPLLPQRPGPQGAVALGDLLYANPQVRGRRGFHDAANPLVIAVPPGHAMSRRLWLGAGTHVVRVQATGRADVALDGRPVLWGDMVEGRVSLDGSVHLVRVEMPNGGELRALAVAPIGR